MRRIGPGNLNYGGVLRPTFKLVQEYPVGTQETWQRQ